MPSCIVCVGTSVLRGAATFNFLLIPTLTRPIQRLQNRWGKFSSFSLLFSVPLVPNSASFNNLLTCDPVLFFGQSAAISFRLTPCLRFGFLLIPKLVSLLLFFSTKPNRNFSTFVFQRPVLFVVHPHRPPWSSIHLMCIRCIKRRPATGRWPRA